MSPFAWSAPLLLISSLLVATPIAAATTEYSTRLAWERAVGDFVLEDFESMPLGSPECLEPDFDYGGCAHPATVETDAFDIVLPMGWHDGGYDGVFEDGVINGSREYRADLHAGVLVAGTAYNTLVFSRPVTAFAVDLAGVEDETCFPECGPIEFPMTIRIGDTDYPVAYGATFFGVTSDLAFSEVVLMNAGRGSFIIPSFDDVAFTPVPEPSTGLLVGLGLAALSRSRARVGNHSDRRAGARQPKG